MENDDIVKILQSISPSHNKQTIYRNLSSLRTIVTNKDQFTLILKNGGIRILTGCLFNNHQNIIDISLSILANCCTDRNCAKEIIKCDGIKILTNILKKWSVDTMICRACRLIGNIAQFDNYASEFHKYGTVAIIVNILNKFTLKSAKETSMATHVMAVRVLKLLWQSYSNRQNMIDQGAVKAVSLVLIKYTEKWTASKECLNSVDSYKKQLEKLLESVLKCLLLFSKYATVECTQQILADGNGFKTLVKLIHLNPYSSVKCLTNLSDVATSRSDIAIVAAVKCILTKVEDHLNKKPNECISNAILSAFCLFCKHPMNCSEIKKAGGLQLILKVLSLCKNKRQEYMIMNAIYGFRFDEESQQIFVSNGLINIILDCLDRNLKLKQDLNESHLFVERIKRHKKRPVTTTCTNNISNRTLKREREEDEDSNGSLFLPEISLSNSYTLSFTSAGGLSPPDSESSFLSSPSCTPPRSEVYNSDDNDSENYSPVCSDAEQEDFVDIETKSLNNMISDQETDDEYDNDKLYLESIDVHERAMIMMLVILSRLSYIKPSSPDLGLTHKRCVIILLKYYRETKYQNSRVSMLLSKIVSNSDNLSFIIKANIIEILHNLTEPEHNLNCNVCFKMKGISEFLLGHINKTAESEEGKKLLYLIILKKSLNDRLKGIIIFPFIVKCKNMILKYVNSYNGLNILMRQFEENSESRNLITAALNKLACNIHINSPITELNSPVNSTLTDKYEMKNTNTNVVTFHLDDGSKVNVDKDFLVKQSDYFKILLTGSFKESTQEIVKLPNVSINALQFLLNLLKTECCNLPPQKLSVKLSIILEVIVLSDRYLLDSLTYWLTRCVEQYLLHVNTASDIYCWSVSSGTNFLRIETIAFLLTSHMKNTERYHLFQNIIDTGFINEIKEDVTMLITRYLKIH